jgi:pantothenate kinase type III
VNSKDLETTENKVEELLKYLWNTVKTFIFGGDETYQGAVNEAKARGHEMSFYIVSTHDESCQNLAQLLACIPCRIIRLKPNDFYSEKEGRYPTMGVDRVANMLGAKCLFGAPNLIVDCGTSLTYTASDCKGNIIGGGIAPGMKMRLDSLGKKTCKLPTITMKEVEQRVKAAECNKSPIPIFATNTEDAIIGNLLGEVSSSVRTIRERWIEEVGTLSGDTIKPKTISDISLMTEMFNDISNHIIDIQSQRAVILTGGASSTLSKVLNQNILVCSKSTSPPCPSVHMVSLIHFGVAYALLKNSRPHTEYIGMRVANSTDTKGDTVIRGSVKWVNKDETFLIQYDDAGQENVTMDKLLSLKKVYDLVGEDRVGNHSHTPSKKQTSKGASSSKDSSGKKRGKSSISSDILKPTTQKKKQKFTPTHISTSPSTPAKAENSGSASKPLVKKDPNHFISKRVAKYFGDELFFGTVTRYNGKYWHISYDDGDNEDMNVKELHQFLKLYTEESVKDIQEK